MNIKRSFKADSLLLRFKRYMTKSSEIFEIPILSRLFFKAAKLCLWRKFKEEITYKKCGCTFRCRLEVFNVLIIHSYFFTVVWKNLLTSRLCNKFLVIPLSKLYFVPDVFLIIIYSCISSKKYHGSMNELRQQNKKFTENVIGKLKREINLSIIFCYLF